MIFLLVTIFTITMHQLPAVNENIEATIHLVQPTDNPQVTLNGLHIQRTRELQAPVVDINSLEVDNLTVL